MIIKKRRRTVSSATAEAESLFLYAGVPPDAELVKGEHLPDKINPQAVQLWEDVLDVHGERINEEGGKLAGGSDFPGVPPFLVRAAIALTLFKKACDQAGISPFATGESQTEPIPEEQPEVEDVADEPVEDEDEDAFEVSEEMEVALLDAIDEDGGATTLAVLKKALKEKGFDLSLDEILAVIGSASDGLEAENQYIDVEEKGKRRGTWAVAIYERDSEDEETEEAPDEEEEEEEEEEVDLAEGDVPLGSKTPAAVEDDDPENEAWDQDPDEHAEEHEDGDQYHYPESKDEAQAILDEFDDDETEKTYDHYWYLLHNRGNGIIPARLEIERTLNRVLNKGRRGADKLEVILTDFNGKRNRMYASDNDDKKVVFVNKRLAANLPKVDGKAMTSHYEIRMMQEVVDLKTLRQTGDVEAAAEAVKDAIEDPKAVIRALSGKWVPYKDPLKGGRVNPMEKRFKVMGEGGEHTVVGAVFGIYDGWPGVTFTIRMWEDSAKHLINDGRPVPANKYTQNGTQAVPAIKRAWVKFTTQWSRQGRLPRGKFLSMGGGRRVRASVQEDRSFSLKMKKRRFSLKTATSAIDQLSDPIDWGVVRGIFVDIGRGADRDEYMDSKGFMNAEDLFDLYQHEASHPDDYGPWFENAFIEQMREWQKQGRLRGVANNPRRDTAWKLKR